MQYPDHSGRVAHKLTRQAFSPFIMPQDDHEQRRHEVWGFTLWLFRKLWNEDPERCYIHLLKTRYFLSSEEIKEFLEVSSAANVDQIFSRSVKFMRENWAKYEK